MLRGVTLLPHPLVRQSFPSPVPPGTGWPEDPASASTPVAASPDDVRRLADVDALAELDARVSVCSACPRLVSWREQVAHQKRASFAAEPYWGRPIAGWGDPAPAVLIVGLAPAANGGNRTGRVFTGDSSGDWLFASLHRVGLAAQATSVHAGDGQRLIGARMVATVRCAPPAEQADHRGAGHLPALDPAGDRAGRLLAARRRRPGRVRLDRRPGCPGCGGVRRPAPAPQVRPRRLGLPRRPRLAFVTLLGCYHPSQQNTFTGRLTPAMLDDVLGRAAALGR